MLSLYHLPILCSSLSKLCCTWRTESLDPPHCALVRHTNSPVHGPVFRCGAPHQQETASSTNTLHLHISAPFFFSALCLLLCFVWTHVHFNWPMWLSCRLTGLLMTSSLRVLGSITMCRNEIQLSCMSISQPRGMHRGGVNATQR